MKFLLCVFVLFGLSSAQDDTSTSFNTITMSNTDALATISASATLPTGTDDACAYLKSQEATVTNFEYPAKDVYNCLKAVQFNRNDARQFFDKWRFFLQYHSTLALLKDPPTTYKQPGVDILKGLDNISAKIDNGYYTSLYDFEFELNDLLRRAHDFHLVLTFGTTQYWNFGIPVQFITISQDGKSIPQVYGTNFKERNLADTLANLANESPIVQINGRPVVDFMSDFVANNTYTGHSEPHAEWESGMSGLAKPAYGGSTSLRFYFGIDTWTFTLANGTQITYPATGTWTSAQKLPVNAAAYYDRFVLATPRVSSFGPLSTATVASSYDPADPGDPTITPEPTIDRFAMIKRDDQPVATTTVNWNSQYSAFPSPNISEVGPEKKTWVTGYFLPDLGVLHVPSFDVSPGGSIAFQRIIQQFITGARSENISKIIIDVRSNSGGTLFAGTELFKQFFPGIFPDNRARFRMQPLANVLGPVFEQAFNSDHSPANSSEFASLHSSPWVPQIQINPNTNSTYKSWNDFVTPGMSQKGDSFSNPMAFDYPDVAVDKAFTGGQVDGIPITGFTPSTDPSPANWSPDNIAILTDGVCGSTCTTFADQYRAFGKGKMITVGGRPESGPMQAYSGSRGSGSRPWTAFISDLMTINSTSSIDKTGLPSPQDVFVTAGGVNLKDTLRPNATWPTQFAYIPADCRMYYTPQTVNNYTALWKAAANALWNTTSDVSGICVNGSTGLKEQMADDVNATTSTSTSTSTSATPSATKKSGASATKVGQSLTFIGLLSAVFLFL